MTRDWLQTPMSVSYGQVLGAGVVLLVLVWIAGTLGLWLYELGRQVKTGKRIEHHLLGRIDALQDSVALFKAALLKKDREERCGRTVDAD